MPPHAQSLGDLVLGPQLHVEPGDRTCRFGQRAVAFDPSRQCVVGQLRVVAYRRTVEGSLRDRSVGRDDHLGHDREPVLLCIERGQIGRQALGQHRKHPRRRVDRGGVGPGVRVDGRTLRDQGIDIGHRHEDLYCAGRQRLAGGELIEIERVVVVDRTPGQLGEIANARILVAAGAGNLGELGQGGSRELRLQSTLGHHFASDTDEVAAICTTFLGHTLLLLPQSLPAAAADADQVRRYGCSTSQLQHRCEYLGIVPIASRSAKVLPDLS